MFECQNCSTKLNFSDLQINKASPFGYDADFEIECPNCEFKNEKISKKENLNNWKNIVKNKNNN